MNEDYFYTTPQQSFESPRDAEGPFADIMRKYLPKPFLAHIPAPPIIQKIDPQEIALSSQNKERG